MHYLKCLSILAACCTAMPSCSSTSREVVRVIPPDQFLAINARASEGDLDAQTELMAHYWSLPETSENQAKARYWQTKAAENGSPMAQGSLAWDYHKGNGYIRDMDKAVYWYTKAATQGEVMAQKALADLYSEGKEVPKNNTESIKWRTAAAKQGDADSQALLGGEYYFGESVEKDLVLAYAWLNLSLVSTHPSRHVFESLRDQAAQEMTRAQIDEAQELSSRLLD